jgi:hypothetical protein
VNVEAAYWAKLYPGQTGSQKCGLLLNLSSLIGAEIQIDKIDPETLVWGILVLVTALLFCMVGTFLAVSCGNLNAKEKMFFAFAWMPKATVQVALGPIFLERAKLLQMTEMYPMGEQILTLAVLSILITGPLGALTIMGLRLRTSCIFNIT